MEEWTDGRTKEEQTDAQSFLRTEEVGSKLQPRSLESSGDARWASENRIGMLAE